MGLVKAFIKLFARDVNDKVNNPDGKTTKQNAYEKTGEELKKAKKTGKYIPGKKAYQNNLKIEKAKTGKTHDKVEKFIDDAF